jgi:hypothetical protein
MDDRGQRVGLFVALAGASASLGRSRPWGQNGRLDQFATSRIGPIVPSQIHSHNKCVASDAWLEIAI